MLSESSTQYKNDKNKIIRKCSASKNNMFQEAIDHCRWKKVLNNVLKEIAIKDYNNKTFEEIIYEIYLICNKVKGIGTLTIYDITSAICRYYKININKVYIIGNGPKRAIKLLKLNTKKHVINNLKLNYVEINDVITGFGINGFSLDEDIRNNTNGDILETYICNWQKTQ
jgi:hypothetical protein